MGTGTVTVGAAPGTEMAPRCYLSPTIADFRSEEHCASISGDVGQRTTAVRRFTDPNSTLVASRYDISCSPAPCGCGGPLGSGAGEQEMSYLLATVVDLGSVKHHTAANITTD